jgi:uncharacterized protein YndB with AHSA1/START domain
VYRHTPIPSCLLDGSGHAIWKRRSTTSTAAQEGASRFVQRRGEDEFGFHGSFHEVRHNEVIVQTFTFEGAPDGVALQRSQFDALESGRTRLTVTSLVGSVLAPFDRRPSTVDRQMGSKLDCGSYGGDRVRVASVLNQRT